mmetsp:Transcript_12211/g.22212  ORF Transcript_12211/g.22212 Transcript_12211/m.22212 type:complete len:134 (-) Transcript_12211:250-651(-)
MMSSRAFCTTSSDLLSSADVASSKSKIRGRRSNARAIAIRCFWPPETAAPPSPTCVSNPSGNETMKSYAFACRAALSISSMVASGRESLMFSFTEVSNRTGSWLTSANCSRSHATLISRRSTPSSSTLPALGS